MKTIFKRPMALFISFIVLISAMFAFPPGVFADDSDGVNWPHLPTYIYDFSGMPNVVQKPAVGSRLSAFDGSELTKSTDAKHPDFDIISKDRQLRGRIHNGQAAIQGDADPGATVETTVSLTGPIKVVITGKNMIGPEPTTGARSGSVKLTFDGVTETKNITSDTTAGSLGTVEFIFFDGEGELAIELIHSGSNDRAGIQKIEIYEGTDEDTGNAPTYSITYDANGATSGTAPTDDADYLYNRIVTVLGKDDLEKDDHTFAGWRIDGTGTVYKEGQTFSITKDTVLVAKWDEIVPFVPQLPAFPGAEGFGQSATGGRSGQVVAVTNLDDSGEGSFRWAMTQYPGEPITVIFEVSGRIKLESELRIKRDNYTIAGQTAPGDGICFMGDKVNLGGSNNFILRHLRFRVGRLSSAPDGSGSIGIENSSNFIVDHCTFGWSAEENTTIYDNKDSTVQWCIIHEGLYDSGHGKGERGYGVQWGGESATYHHNLLAHNVSRSPRFNGARSETDKNVLIDFVNNVNYNWGKRNSSYGGDINTGDKSHRLNFVGNYYKPGPAFPGTESSEFIEVYWGNPGHTTEISKWHMSGNVMEGSANEAKTADNYLGLDWNRFTNSSGITPTPEQYRSDTPFEVPYTVTTQSAADAYASVLEEAGALPRDSVDERIIGEVRTGTATGFGSYSGGAALGMIDDPEAVGGYPTYDSLPAPVDTDGDGIPDEWEIEYGLNPNDPADGNGLNLSEEGYTNLEMYLNQLAGDPVVFAETGDKSVEVGMRTGTLAQGTAGNVTFAVTTQNIANGTPITLNNTGAVEGVSLVTTATTGASTVVTIRTTESTPSGTHSFTITIDGVESNSFDLTVHTMRDGNIQVSEDGSIIGVKSEVETVKAILKLVNEAKEVVYIGVEKK